MSWVNVPKEAFPLSTVSFLGDWKDIPKPGDPTVLTGGLQYILELEPDWLINPPALYAKAWGDYIQEQQSSFYDRNDWTWGKSSSQKETLKALEGGMPPKYLLDVYNKAQASLKALMLPSAPSARRRRYYNEDDGEPDVDIALSGRESYLIRKPKQMVNNRIVHLAWQLAHSHVEDESAFARQAAAAVAVTDQIEKYGYRVRLTGYIALSTGHAFRQTEASNLGEKSDKIAEILFRIPIKHESAPVDEMKLICFGLPGVLRFYGLAWLFAAMGSPIGGGMNSGCGRVLYNKDVIRAISRVDHVSAVVSSDAPAMMHTLIEEI